jgi:S1-C subfamily serine protease
MSEVLRDLNDAMAAVVSSVRRGLVQIHGEEAGSIGAGTVWHPDGLIITNAHVVIDHQNGQPRKGLKVVLSDFSEYDAKLLTYDLRQDLAALAIDAKDLPTIEIGNSNGLRPGQWVLALGHPWGILEALTAGIVIGAGDNLPEMTGRDWVALSLKLRPGHSGGPLVDVNGRLVGINTLITGPGVGFAIPVQVVKTFLKETIGTFVVPAEESDAEEDVEVVVI